jgi:hypothetical protein
MSDDPQALSLEATNLLVIMHDIPQAVEVGMFG